jgi:hypothetical protein
MLRERICGLVQSLLLRAGTLIQNLSCFMSSAIVPGARAYLANLNYKSLSVIVSDCMNPKQPLITINLARLIPSMILGQIVRAPEKLSCLS